MNEEKKPKNPDVPCKGCERRCAGCHSKCPDYEEYKTRLERRAVYWVAAAVLNVTVTI